jgi:site-specific DNA recombinase
VISYRDSYLSLDPTNTDSLEPAKSHEGLQIRIDPGLIEEFGCDMQGTLTNGSMAFRKAYLQSLIEVDDNVIRIKGARICSKRPSWLAKAVVIRVRR